MSSWRDLAVIFRGPVRDLLALGGCAVVALGSLVALIVGRVDLGVSLAVVNDRLLIGDVRPGSPASREGFQPGMVVLRINNAELVRLAEPGGADQEPVEEPDGLSTAEPDARPSPATTVPPAVGPSAPVVVPSAPVVSPGASPDAATTAPSAAVAPPGSGAASESTGPAATNPATPAAVASPSGGAIAPVGSTPGPSASPTRGPILAIDPRVLALLPTEPIRQLTATTPSEFAQYLDGQPFSWTYLGRDYEDQLALSAYLLVAGLLVLVLGTWLVATGRVGEALRPLAVPLSAAVALPLMGRPLEATWTSSAATLAAIAIPFGIAPLGLAFADRIEEAESRGIARMAAVGATSSAMLVGVGRALSPGASGRVTDAGLVGSDLVWLASVGAVALIPGVLAAFRRRPAAATAPSRSVLQSNELALAGATPLMSLATGISSLPLFLPLSGWLAAIAVAGRWTVRPLLRVAARATLQRDLVVAATEAERARVAAEIHDDALQELTLLVRRLDDAGDAEGADIARTVSERLRAICGDLRLPILDDLGVGPALDWLAERMERLSGGPVRLERVGDARLPPDVELAFFRIAQEALGNAVKHGKAPITIRFHASEGAASLAVDDAGPGIPADAAEEEDGSGRFGILNMRQRAEQIGALLDIRRWPTGGTHVALEWRAR
jgi:signal transduction histidine kinase